MRNAVSEIKKTLGVVGQKTSFIGVVSMVDGNSVTVLDGNHEEVVRADGHFAVGDEIIIENGVVVGLVEKPEVVVWV